jgi:EAL domain-containing protein (putative c-di-GMP-specific phosphodiesterase class I)
VARGVGSDDVDLSLWRLLAGAASDDESVELDRLCRMLHAINFFRQDPAPGAELLLSVHDRLLSAVSINHGYAFRRVLDALGLPVSQVILQLPVVTSNQRWLVSYVADNYRRNGFRVALQIDDTAQAHALLAQARPALLRIDAGSIGTDHELTTLLALAQDHGARVLIKQVQSLSTRQQLERATALGYTLQAQGDAIDAAGNALHAVYGAHSTVAQALTA